MRYHLVGLLVVFLAVVVNWGLAEGPQRSSGAQRAYDQFREFYLGTANGVEMRDTNEVPPDPRQSTKYAKTLAADGHWPDLDYASKALSGWPQERHCSRMVAMAVTAEMQGTPPADRAMLLTALHRAFGYWIEHDFQCPNWWYNEIGIPKLLGTLAILLGDNLTPQEYQYATDVSLKRFPIARTGQNKVWLAGNTLMRGLLMGDENTIRTASDAIWSEVTVSTAEGVQPDFSFHQHGPQLQFGNYGMAFAVENARWCGILRDTPWQLPAEKLEVFRSYLLDGQNWVSWRGVMDISSCGRQLMPHSPRSKTTTIARVMKLAESFDAGHRAAYEAYVARNRPGAGNDLFGNRFFWRSDYVVHRRPTFAATLKLSSNRVIGAELVNHENLLGYHEADGALYFYRTGNEYEDIFPVWDWSKLPGVTCALVSPPTYKTTAVPRDFVGGVSDGSDGVFVLDYVRDGVQAHKAWFFSGDTVVCLGSGISSSGTAAIATTINQCLRRGPVKIKEAGTTEELDGAKEQTLAHPDEIEHDGWRISFLEPTAVHLASGPVTGNWRRVFDNPETPPNDVTADVFTLWIDHGATPHAAHYAYAVTPLEAPPASKSIRVLENSDTKQVVELSPEKTALVFWAPGEIAVEEGKKIAADAPCVMLVSSDAVRVSDPTQKRSTLVVTINGVAHEVTLPQKEYAGTSVVVK